MILDLWLSKFEDWGMGGRQDIEVHKTGTRRDLKELHAQYLRVSAVARPDGRGKISVDGTVAGRCMGRTPSMPAPELEPVTGSSRCGGEAALGVEGQAGECNVAFCHNLTSITSSLSNATVSSVSISQR